MLQLAHMPLDYWHVSEPMRSITTGNQLYCISTRLWLGVLLLVPLWTIKYLSFGISRKRRRMRIRRKSLHDSTQQRFEIDKTWLNNDDAPIVNFNTFSFQPNPSIPMAWTCSTWELHDLFIIELMQHSFDSLFEFNWCNQLCFFYCKDNQSKNDSTIHENRLPTASHLLPGEARH